MFNDFCQVRAVLDALGSQAYPSGWPLTWWPGDVSTRHVLGPGRLVRPCQTPDGMGRAKLGKNMQKRQQKATCELCGSIVLDFGRHPCVGHRWFIGRFRALVGCDFCPRQVAIAQQRFQSLGRGKLFTSNLTHFMTDRHTCALEDLEVQLSFNLVQLLRRFTPFARSLESQRRSLSK